MRCTTCGGGMHQGTAPFGIDRKGYALTLRVVPAWVCQRCGETLFGENEVEAIQELLRSLDEKVKSFVANESDLAK